MTTTGTTEAEAAEVTMRGNPWERARVGVGALRRLLRDPDDTTQVFIMGLALNASQFPGFLARFAADAEGARLLREQPSIDRAHVDFDALGALPVDTLGGAYARYLAANNLDPDLFQTPPGLPEIPAFLSRRLRQVHDIWHVLTGYHPDVPGEVALQGFTYAQTGMPSALLIATFGSLRGARKTPDLPRRALDGYRRGRDAAFLSPVIWEEHWADSLDSLRARYRVRPVA